MDNELSIKILGKNSTKTDIDMFTNIPKGYPLSERQKQILSFWTPPMGTTSAVCTRCKRFYSIGFLQICEATFCGYDCEPPISINIPKPLSDETLKEWFGFERKNLKE